MLDLREKEKEVEISRLQHAILEKELKLIRKIKEVERVEKEIENAKKLLAEKTSNKG